MQLKQGGAELPLTFAQNMLLGVGGITFFRYFSPSPMLFIVCALLFAFFLASSRHPAGVEHFPPVYMSGTVSGLQYGVAAVQGRRAYMEDMHQIVGFDNEAAVASVGMTHLCMPH